MSTGQDNVVGKQVYAMIHQDRITGAEDNAAPKQGL